MVWAYIHDLGSSIHCKYNHFKNWHFVTKASFRKTGHACGMSKKAYG